MGACFRYLFMEGTDFFGASELVDRSAHADNPRLERNSGTLLNFVQSHMV
jgi:hypothetical protein